jgi:very-short-patch-repair endonuclease
LIYNDYVDQHSKIKIICKKHGIFEQLACNHTNGNGCQVCSIKDSIGQKIIRKFLKERKISFKEQKIFKKCVYKKYLLFDFYLIDNNICIEYDGIQHFESIEYFGGDSVFNETKIRDKIKNEYCKNNNIHLIRISYKELILSNYYLNYF